MFREVAMTTLASLEQANKDRIKAGPHWRVTIRPTTFDPVLLSSSDACWDVVITRQVRVPGGHTYPVADLWPGREEGDDWVAFDAEWSYWRYYQSGLFVNVFTFAEDDAAELRTALERARSRGGYEDLPDSTRFADPANLLRTVTMLYEFAARLGAHGLLGANGSIEIALNDVRGRRLFAGRFPVPQQAPRFCMKEDNVTVQRRLEVVELLSSPLRLAREHAMRLFAAFGWDAQDDGWMRQFQQQAFPDRSVDS
jgi:hypothetical protein